ncbi:MAG: phosphoribosylformylglycinamidine synthase subunit PurS, partial [Deltaproteobacteria bacterium]|nr:phosphoribosylformylglycinamidine synthase subunit PurS [Deltaproteobacteria bacterium]
MKAKIYITLKNEVLDPQGQAIQGSLKTLGFAQVLNTRVGKLIELDLNFKEKEIALDQV